jgi:cardiolipin synthase C
MKAILILLGFALACIPQSRADEVQYLARPETALSAFLKVAREAQKSIDIVTFIFEPCDASSQLLMEILAEKAKQGVRVRILLDDFTQLGEQKNALANFAAKNNIQLKFFNTFEKNFRIHAKLIVSDGKIYISGGRNISDKYFGLSAEKNYVDRDVFVRGDSAVKAATSFEEMWNVPLSKRKVGNPRNFTGWSKFCKYDETARMDSIKDFLDRNSDLLDRVPVRDCNSVEFISDNPRFPSSKFNGSGEGLREYMNPTRLKEKRASKKILEFIVGAQTHLNMENWVYIPISGLSNAIKAARDNKVSIRTITNRDTEDGPKVFRQVMDYAVSVYAKKHTKKSQVVSRLSTFGSVDHSHALTPRGVRFFLHGKTYVRDYKDVVVGSFNLDSRSYSINVESLVYAKDCSLLARDVEDHTEELHRIYEYDKTSGKVPPESKVNSFVKLMARALLGLL